MPVRPVTDYGGDGEVRLIFYGQVHRAWSFAVVASVVFMIRAFAEPQPRQTPQTPQMPQTLQTQQTSQLSESPPPLPAREEDQ